MHAPSRSNFFHFHAVFLGRDIGKIIPFHVYTPLELISFLGNIGSVTGMALGVIVAIVPCEHVQLRFSYFGLGSC